jgi:hypothetical protein
MYLYNLLQLDLEVKNALAAFYRKWDNSSNRASKFRLVEVPGMRRLIADQKNAITNFHAGLVARAAGQDRPNHHIFSAAVIEVLNNSAAIESIGRISSHIALEI